jgi:conjugal transfer pilus assembly protein TraU
MTNLIAYCRRLVGIFAALCAALLAIAGLGHAYAGSATCFGKFANPITDICWSCTLPMSIGSARLMSMGQDDIANPPNALCFCGGAPPTVGVEVGFWEPARTIEVTRTPFCLVSLGGISMDPGLAAPRGTQDSRAALGSATRGSFYQVHYYTNPVLYWLEVLLQFPCLEKGSLDIAYMTELDPLWGDDELTAVLNAETVLFANPAAIAACSADCVAATSGMPVKELFWCAGCQGGMYPMSGHVAAQYGGVQGSSLLMQRMLGKMHRQLLAWRWHGQDATCGPKLAPVMDKTAYKTQLLYPIPNTGKLLGQCCQPLGRTTQLWGAGKEFPIKGEDFAYMVFRKRNCCAGF